MSNKTTFLQQSLHFTDGNLRPKGKGLLCPQSFQPLSWSPLSPPSSLWAQNPSLFPGLKHWPHPCCHHFHALPISAPSVPRSRNPSFLFILQPIFVETFWLRAKSSLNKLKLKVPPGLVDRAAIYSHRGCALYNFRKCHSHRLLLNWYPLDLCSTQPIYT